MALHTIVSKALRRSINTMLTRSLLSQSDLQSLEKGHPGCYNQCDSQIEQNSASHLRWKPANK